MRAYQFAAFGLENLAQVELPAPAPGPGQALVEVRAFSLNFRDLLVLRGQYNPRLRLPATPVSDGAGVVRAVGPGVTRVRVGQDVMTHFVAPWTDGPFRTEHVGGTLGCPGAGLAAELAVVPQDALLPLPSGYDYEQAATLPIAALTAWSALVTEGGLTPENAPGRVVLTLGTGGVSIFALQIAKAFGARVAITSSSDEKLLRARALGADWTINYRSDPEWERTAVQQTGGGADLTLENGGIATLSKSLVATRPGGLIALLGALTGLAGHVQIGPVLMKRLRIAGIMVDSRASFERLVQFLERHAIRPVIDRVLPFDQFPEALRCMERGEHFGKIVVRVE